MSERATSEARAWGPSVAMNMEANPQWHVHMCTSKLKTPTLNAIGLANITEMFIISKIACIIYLFVSAIGEIASAYVAIAVRNCVRRMRNGNLN